MREERLIELLIELHLDTPRQGPGERASTLRALDMCGALPPAPDVLDVGCGTGSSTLVLAEATHGRVTAVDFCAGFLKRLTAEVRERGLEGRVRVLQADMKALPLPPAAFDLIWSEGAIYSMGFDNGLRAWRKLLRPGGKLAVTEVSWLTPDPPQEARKRWAEWYPGIRGVRANVDAAQELGYRCLGTFVLPVRAWAEEYHAPLRPRLAAFRAQYAHDPEGLAVADMTATEMELFKRCNQHYNYVFYVFERAD